ncbi:MAG: hypothetical protein AAGD38_11870 [Acidobacteriota bacterium]
MNHLDTYHQLVNRADDTRHRHPARALDLALEARDVAARLDNTDHDTWIEAQTIAWSVVASAYRNVGRLDDAEAAMVVAIGFHEQRHEPCPRLAARLMQRAAYVRADQERLDEALELIDVAVSTYRDLDAANPLATAIIDRGVLLGRAGRPRHAIAAFNEALDTHAHALDDRARLAAIHNLAVHLHEIAADTESRREADRWLELAWHAHAEHPETVGLLKLRGLCALAALRHGDHERAIEELWAACDGFARLGDHRQQTLFLIDLAVIHAERHDFEGLNKVATACFLLLRSRDDHDDEATATALLRLARAIATGTPSQDELRQAATYLE